MERSAIVIIYTIVVDFGLVHVSDEEFEAVPDHEADYIGENETIE